MKHDIKQLSSLQRTKINITVTHLNHKIIQTFQISSVFFNVLLNFSCVNNHNLIVYQSFKQDVTLEQIILETHQFGRAKFQKHTVSLTPELRSDSRIKSQRLTPLDSQCTLKNEICKHCYLFVVLFSIYGQPKYTFTLSLPFFQGVLSLSKLPFTQRHGVRLSCQFLFQHDSSITGKDNLL